MAERVMVVGAGGHAKVVIDVLRAAGHEVAALFDDNAALHGQVFRGVPVLGAGADVVAHAAANGLWYFLVAIGHNVTRLGIGRRLEAAGLVGLAAAHPSAVLAPGVVLGSGTVVMPGACINADTRIGAHGIVNTGARVDHDCALGDGVHLAPGVVLCGNVSVGELAFVGAGATVIPGMSVGARASVGAAAAVVRPVAADSKVRGVPARPYVE
ncbi:MAG: NeuD/PglB/VioB family sugar acetyltransferase [Pseudomonadota bacterium]